ncbi:MAG TPA: hypothetical protein ENK18_06735 [Deltaproteobacteria bacterium]|nr:hypothetical protein [Deltaproteobacteria bacterium]
MPRVDTEQLRDAYRDYMALAEPGCPPLSDPPGAWLAECTTADGVLFSGYATEEINGDLSGSDWQLSGSAVVDRRGEATLQLEGVAGLGSARLIGIDVAFQYGYGWFQEVADHDGGWLMQPISVGLYVQSSRVAIPEGPRELYVEGLLDGLAGELDQAVEFVGMQISGEGWPGASCVGAPVGMARVQLPEGGWVVLDFGDGWTPRCDSCAAATLDGIFLGEVCADFSAWLDWEETPWGRPR